MTTNMATKKVKAKSLVIRASSVALAENVTDTSFLIVGMVYLLADWKPSNSSSAVFHPTAAMEKIHKNIHLD